MREVNGPTGNWIRTSRLTVTPVNILEKGKAIARVPLLIGVIWNSNNLMRGTNRVILGTDMLQEDEAGVLTFERLGQKIEHCIDDDELVLVRDRCRKACAIELNEALGEGIIQLFIIPLPLLKDLVKPKQLQFQSASLSFNPKFVPYSAGKECIYRPREAIACTYFALYLRRARMYKYNTRR